MANLTNSNNYTNQKSKNTRGIQLYNKVQGMGSTIVLDFWDKYVSIKIHPMLPNADSGKMYDYDHGCSIVLGLDSLVDIQFIMNEIETSIKEMGHYPAETLGITTGKNDKFIQIGSLEAFGLQGEGLAIEITNNIVEGKSENAMLYVMNKGAYFKNYNRKTGEYDSGNIYEKDFIIIKKFIDKAVEEFTMATAHVVGYDYRYKHSSLSDALIRIQQKFGIDTKGNISLPNGMSNNISGPSFFNNNNTQQAVAQVETGTVQSSELLVLD